ncbi:MAG: hypothetical protein JXA78_05480 [Anaerolineales bacterium]|nr:hypothetical protein [Anaerolineales bacterium]
MIKLASVLFGIALLIAGRKLYWLFVGAIGFVVGIILAEQIFVGASDLVLIAIALAAGVIGAFLAVALQRLALIVAGFLAGGYILMTLLNTLGLNQVAWLPFLIGGIIGAVLVAMLFDPALVVLSALLGASMLVELLFVERWVGLALLAALTAIGITIQFASMRDRQR